MTKVRAIRGATTSDNNTKDDIVEATREMLISLVEANDLKKEDVISAFFTTTKDLNTQFPGKFYLIQGNSKYAFFTSSQNRKFIKYDFSGIQVPNVK